MFSSLSKYFFWRKRGSETRTPADDIILLLEKLVIQQSLIADEMKRYEKTKNLPVQSREISYIPIYFSLEAIIVANKPPAVRKAYTTTDLRTYIRKTIPVDRLQVPFRLIFLEGVEQNVLLFEIGIRLLVDYVVKYIGDESLIRVVNLATRGTVLEKIVFKNQSLDFSRMSEELKQEPLSEIIRTFKNLSTALYGHIEELHGDTKAREVVRGIYDFIKTTYDRDFVSQFLNILPDGVLEVERLAFLSREELEKKIQDRTMELNELNKNLEERVKERTGELTEANIRLKELDRIKSEFISVAAHQLRTPTTEIKWLLNSLLEHPDLPPPTFNKRLNDAFSSTNYLATIINDLLDVTRIEEGRMFLDIQQRPYIPVLQAIYSNFENIAKKKGIKLYLNLPKALPDIKFDEGKIKIVLDNLIDNAIKYTLSGGSVSIDTKLMDNRLTTVITDTGIGIADANSYRIFTKFYRAPEAQLLHTDGMGLGLYVTKNIIEQHGGTIDFKSKEGEGTAFYFSLPLS